MADAHDVAERARVLSHHIYADEIRARPSVIDEARERLVRAERAGAATGGQQLWLQLLDLPVEAVIAAMTEDSAVGRLLRSNSPFSVLIGVSEEGRRRAIWREARAQLAGGSGEAGR